MLLRSEEEVAMVSISHCLQDPEGNLFSFCQRQALGEHVVPEAWKPTEVELKVRADVSVWNVCALPISLGTLLRGNPCSLGISGTYTLISSSII
jgi:hypothetical protein